MAYNGPRFAVVTVDAKGDHVVRMFQTADSEEKFVNEIPRMTPYYRTKVTSACTYGEIAITSAGRKAGTKVEKKEKKA